MRCVLPIFCRFGLLAAGVLALPLLAGCPDVQPPELRGSGMEMFGPLTMRIHPLSRLMPTQSTGQVEVRMELTDQMGDVGKGVGTAYFELYNYEFAAAGHKGPRVGLWNADISTPTLNKQHWDSITRTYFFRLGMADSGTLKTGAKYVISATLVLPNESRLNDDLIVTAN